MIVTVTPNPAIDVTYDVDALRPGEVHRVRQVRERAGGKGVNVARVLHALGEQVLATGLSGGPGGAALSDALDAAEIAAEFVDALPDVRRTLVVRDGAGSTTSLWEPGRSPVDPAATADRLTATVRGLLPRTRALSVSGSLPPGVDPAVPARLAGLAAAAGVPAVLDLSGEPLRVAAADGKAVLLPNADEAAELAGYRPASPAAAAELARDLVHRNGLPAVMVTLGADGVVVAHQDGCLAARPDEPLAGNPTGAGDAVCAAVVRALANDGARGGGFNAVDWRALTANAVALSAAAILRPVAGEVDLAAYRRWREQIVVEEP